MVKVIFMSSAGLEYTIDAKPGSTLMEVARDNGIQGIAAECGGACSCATCHVHVADDWADRLPTMNATEADMLEFADGLDERRSRLSCQIVLSDGIDGLYVTVPT